MLRWPSSGPEDLVLGAALEKAQALLCVVVAVGLRGACHQGHAGHLDRCHGTFVLQVAVARPPMATRLDKELARTGGCRGYNCRKRCPKSEQTF